MLRQLAVIRLAWANTTMTLHYTYRGASSVSQFDHYVDGILERRRGDLERAIEDQQARFFLHVLIGEVVARSRLGLPGMSFGFGPVMHFSGGSYYAVYVIEATKTVPKSAILRPFLGKTKEVHLGVEGERLIPHKHAGVSRPQHYARFVVDIADEIIQKGKDVQMYAYDIGEETITDRYVKAAVAEWQQAQGQGKVQEEV